MLAYRIEVNGDNNGKVIWDVTFTNGTAEDNNNNSNTDALHIISVAKSFAQTLQQLTSTAP